MLYPNRSVGIGVRCIGVPDLCKETRAGPVLIKPQARGRRLSADLPPRSASKTELFVVSFLDVTQIDTNGVLDHASLAIGLHPIGVNAMEQGYAELLNEYRLALGLWSETRALYSPDRPEVIAATRHLDSLEQDLASYSQSALVAA